MRKPKLLLAKSSADQAPRVEEMNRRLKRAYGSDLYRWAKREPLDQLLFAVISQSTREKPAITAFNNLRARFSDWNEMIGAPPEVIRREIAASTYAGQKAKQLQK